MDVAGVAVVRCRRERHERRGAPVPACQLLDDELVQEVTVGHVVRVTVSEVVLEPPPNSAKADSTPIPATSRAWSTSVTKSNDSSAGPTPVAAGLGGSCGNSTVHLPETW